MTAWLLTWLWQGVALAVSLLLVLHLLPRVNAATRYVLWWGAFAALLYIGWQAWPASAIGNFVSNTGGSAEPALLIQVQPLPASVLSLIAMIWASVALFKLLQIIPSLNALYRLKDECRPFPRGLEEQLPFWLEAGGRRVRLALCDRLPGAALLGLHDPCIALPSAVVDGLSSADLDQIILHEYGHVQRRDDWMRLLQTLLEAALWMHPATFLIGRELSLEREVACDDWVIARTRSPRNYARCLSRVAEQTQGRVRPALAQPLFGGQRDLVRRVDRLLDSRRNARRRVSVPGLAFGTLVIAVCAVQLRAVPLVTDALPQSVAIPAAHLTRAPLVTLTRAVSVATPAVPIDSPGDQAIKMISQAPVTRDPGVNGVRLPASPAVNIAATDAKPEFTGVATAQTGAAEPAVLLPTKSFEGVYHVPVRRTESRSALTPWQAAGNAGAGIGAATRDASVGLAMSVAKVGTAIGRSF
jgi:beta-lactamase regulating signal transducer with metallopeptidase domain